VSRRGTDECHRLACGSAWLTADNSNLDVLEAGKGGVKTYLPSGQPLAAPLALGICIVDLMTAKYIRLTPPADRNKRYKPVIVRLPRFAILSAQRGVQP
jgi:hypothetical protein